MSDAPTPMGPFLDLERFLADVRKHVDSGYDMVRDFDGSRATLAGVLVAMMTVAVDDADAKRVNGELLRTLSSLTDQQVRTTDDYKQLMLDVAKHRLLIDLWLMRALDACADEETRTVQ